jgi:transcriptional regulator with XRE-family HTH domain
VQRTGNLFLEVRLLAGITQRDCARLLGISQGMLFRLERGERVKSFDPIRRAIYVAALKEMCSYV